MFLRPSVSYRLKWSARIVACSGNINDMHERSLSPLETLLLFRMKGVTEMFPRLDPAAQYNRAGETLCAEWFSE